jgi:RNAse (barnase) inhibitor barstar
MTRKPAEGLPVVFRIDGRKVKSANDFYREIGSSVNGPGGYFGSNLDALADCLRGGFGTPDNRPYEFEWQHSAVSQRYLANVRHAQHTLFDAIREVFSDAGVTLILR